MSVVGFDIGNANCYIAVARAGGIETVANEYSDRCTPAIVGFTSKNRIVGISAKNQRISNIKSTIAQFKRLVGRKFDEQDVQNELKYNTCKIVKLENGDVGVQVTYRGEQRVFTPEQIMAMLLSELKSIAETNLQKVVTDCVISVPSFYTDFQRRALLRATKIASLNCLKLMNETSAVALNYGLFKQDLPAPDQKPRHVVFVDVGHSALQVSVAAFNKGKIKVLATAADPNFGGRDFDERLKSFFADDFQQKYKLNVRSNPRAWTRLGTEAEKIKKQMSTNSITLPLNIECFMEDMDVSSKINREQFEEMSRDLLARVAQPLQQALQDSGLSEAEIDFIELVGGSSRVPAIKSIIESVMKKPASTTLNLDEAVARGCSIQCAMLSHTVRVRDIEVMDAAPYPIHISWDARNPEEGTWEMEVFKRFHSYPFTKMLTFPHRVEPFCFRAFYHEKTNIPHFEKSIGKFVVNAGAPTESDDTSKVKVKVKVRLDINGCLTVSSASMVETLPTPPPEAPKEEPMDTTPATPEVNGEKPKEEEAKPSETPSQGEATAKTEDTKKTEKAENGKSAKDKKEEPKKTEAKKKKLTKSTELKVVSEQSLSGAEELNKLIEAENELIAQIRHERALADAKNAVEEYVYDMRGKIYDTYEKYVTDEDREVLRKALSETEDWLYEDGENQSKQVYIDKLAELKKFGQPIVDRYIAYENLPASFEKFGQSITHFRKIVDLYSKKDEKYSHIEESEMKKVQDKIEEKFKWFNEKMQLSAKTPPTSNPVVYPSQILSEKKILDDFCNPIVNKAKPKVEPPPPPKEEVKKEESSKQPEEGANSQQPENMETEDKTPTPTTNKNLDMEVD